MTDSMNSGMWLGKAGWLRPWALWERVAEALSSGRQLWSRGRAGAAAWLKLLATELWPAQLG